MTLCTFPNLVQGSDEWLTQRRGMITASVVDALLSVRHPGPEAYDCPKCGATANNPCVSQARGATPGPIKTMHPDRVTLAADMRDTAPLVVEPSSGTEARSLALLLAAERITGWTDPTYMSDDMLRGVEDEPRAIDAYSAHHSPVQTIGLMVRDDTGHQIGYSPDGLVGDVGLVEVKSRRAKNQLATVLAGDVPAENMAQIQCGLLVSGRAWCDYISFTGGMPLWVKRVYPDERWFTAINAAVDAAEQTIAAMVSTYRARTEGLPMTERVTDMEMVI